VFYDIQNDYEQKKGKEASGGRNRGLISASIPFTFHNDATEFIILIIQKVSKICD
jgi:hypothetical protein